MSQPEAAEPGRHRQVSPQPDIPVVDGMILRPWRPNDASYVVKAFSDPDIRAWHGHELDDIEAATKWIAGWRDRWVAQTGAAWAITATWHPNAILGQVALRQLFLDAGMAECSYWVVPDYRGAGIASKATRAMSDWAFGALDLYRLEIVHSVRNHRSCRVAIKAGFEPEGIKRSLQRYESGGFHDMHLHAKVKPAQTRVTALDRAILDIIAHPRLFVGAILLSAAGGLLAWLYRPVAALVPPTAALALAFLARPLVGRSIRKHSDEAGSQPVTSQQ